MVVFLTGGTGLAGSAIAEAAARRGHTVIATAFRSDASPPGVERLLRVDLRKEAEATRVLLDVFPDVVINAAAISEPAKCDEDPAGSAQVNIHLPETLARLCHHLCARLIHLSTDMVFDGCSGNYPPSAPTAPGSEYGRQKLAAEEAVAKAAPELSTIIRTTLLMGNSPGGRRSVHEKLFELWSKGDRARLFDDEMRQPCLAENLGDAVVEVAERNDLFGTFHWAGAEKISRFGIGQRLLEHFKLPSNLIEKTSLTSDPRFATRPADLTLDLTALAGKLKTRPLNFQEQLERLKVPAPYRTWYNSL